jgi:DNA repair exonuclease SbcCD ATPase subunit
MRKPLQFVLAAAVVVLAGAAAFFYSQFQKTTASYSTLQASDQATRDQYEQTINSIAEIQDSLNALALGNSKVPAESQSLTAERKMGVPTRQEALDRIAMLRASLDRSKERIQRLEQRVHSSGIKIAGLQRMLTNLKESSAQKEQELAELTAQVDQLKTQVSGLTEQVAQTQDTVRVRDADLEMRRRELATVYYVAGTKHDLAQSGVITARGGILGIGKTIVPSKTPGTAQFEALDTDREQVVHLASARAQVITAQPASSYELRLVDGKMELHILVPEEFRKVRQLVIVTA